MWLAAENGMFLRSTKGEWMTTMPEHLNMDWVDSVKVCVIVLVYHPWVCSFEVQIDLVILTIVAASD